MRPPRSSALRSSPVHAAAALLAIALAAPTTACVARPARFAEAAPVTHVADDEPIDMPLRLEVNDVVEFSDLFVGRPLVEAMRTTRRPPPGDINALDEVPVSSWFSPIGADASHGGPPYAPGPVDAATFEMMYAEGGSPVPPYRVLLERAPSGKDGIPVMDALGRRFELRRDLGDRPEMRTAAAAIAARLVRAAGYHAPEVYVTDASEGDFTIAPGEDHPQAILSGTEPTEPPQVRRQLRKVFDEWVESAPPTKSGALRFSATRWPPGVDVGRTPAMGVRGDDPNDRVPHEDRRTLRALKLLGAWLGFTRFTPHELRDVYVGLPGEGHLRHYMVGMDRALGTESIVGKRPEQKNEMLLLATLGFAPDPNIPPTQRKYVAIGAIGEEVDPGNYGPGLPFPPWDYTNGADHFWIAKRIADVTEETVLLAVRAGKVSNGTARRLLFELILARQRSVIAWGYAQTTACDVESVTDRGLVVVDRAVAAGHTTGKKVEYVVSYHDGAGDTSHPGAVLGPEGARFAIPLPKAIFAKDGYAIVRLQSEIGGKPAPRKLEVHLKRRGTNTRILGLRH